MSFFFEKIIVFFKRRGCENMTNEGKKSEDVENKKKFGVKEEAGFKRIVREGEFLNL